MTEQLECGMTKDYKVAHEDNLNITASDVFDILKDNNRTLHQMKLRLDAIENYIMVRNKDSVRSTGRIYRTRRTHNIVRNRPERK